VGILQKMRRGLDAVDRVLTWIACISILAMMFIVGTDVLLRYFFGAPLPWAYDLVSLYLINAILYLTFSEALRTHNHIGLDLRLPESWAPAVRVARIVFWFLVLAVVMILAWVVGKASWQSFWAGERVPGRFEWIVWIKLAIVALGATMLSVRIALMLLSRDDLEQTAGETGLQEQP
jgi:TRAP-type C4-dicarboxylate transport system permease small subunit